MRTGNFGFYFFEGYGGETENRRTGFRLAICCRYTYTLGLRSVSSSRSRESQSRFHFIWYLFMVSSCSGNIGIIPRFFLGSHPPCLPRPRLVFHYLHRTALQQSILKAFNRFRASPCTTYSSTHIGTFAHTGRTFFWTIPFRKRKNMDRKIIFGAP